MKITLAYFSSVFAVFFGVAHADTLGKDYATHSFKITTGATVVINAYCETTNVRNGNRTRLFLQVNGKTVRDRTVDADRLEESYKVSGNGSYDAYLRCYNEQSDAYIARLTSTKEEVPIY